VRINIAEAIRFINELIASPSLESYLGAQDEEDALNYDELIAFLRVRFQILKL
jgi:hypothetical protein